MRIKALLEKYNLRPSKSLGQNFLYDEGIARKVIAAADLTPADHVIEVGSGLGILTRPLAEQAGRVVAIELDRCLVEILRETLSPLSNIEIVEGDVLRTDLVELVPPGVPYKVIANLPYYITSAAIRHFLEATRRPQLLVIMVQREVAERILAAPGKMSLLSVGVQFYGQPHLVARVSRGAFYPSPRVDSAILRIDVYDHPPVWGDNPARFFQVVRAGFSQRRKQLRNSLSARLGLSAQEITDALRAHNLDEKLRPQTLSIEDWGKICDAIPISR
jgi:16S rRNA (adenine1518-N6/adenine1519-N6)-dimethyltransferase